MKPNDIPNVFIFCILLAYYRVPFLNQFIILAFNDSISSFCSNAVIFHWNNLDLLMIEWVVVCKLSSFAVLLLTLLLQRYFFHSRCGKSKSIAIFSKRSRSKRKREDRNKNSNGIAKWNEDRQTASQKGREKAKKSTFCPTTVTQSICLRLSIWPVEERRTVRYFAKSVC